MRPLFTVRSLLNLALLGPLLLVQSSRDRYRPQPPPSSMAEMLVDQARQRGQLNRKLLLLDEAIRIDPRSVRALNERALLLEQMERPREALADVDRALDLDSTSGTLHFNRANLLAALGRNEEAIESYTRSQQLDPRPTTLLNRAAAYLATNQPRLALKDLQQAATTDPNLPALGPLIDHLTPPPPTNH